MTYSIFAKYAAEALHSGVGKALAVAGAVPGSLENAPNMQALYQDPETATFDPNRAGEAMASTFTTMPGMSETIDRAVADPRVAGYFKMLKNNPDIRLTLMGTHSMMPIMNEMEDRMNRRQFAQQQQMTKQQLEQAGSGMKSRADEAAEQAAAIEEYRDEYNRLARVAGDKVDPAEVTRRVATARGAGTHQRLASIEQLARETSAKPGLNIVHRNLNLARRRELNRKIEEQRQMRQSTAQSNYDAFAQVGGLYNQVATMPGPDRINTAPRINLQKLKQNIAANLAAQNTAAKQAAAATHNVFDLLLPQDQETIGRHKRTVMYIRRHNDEDGGVKEHIRDRVQERFEQQNQFPLLNNKKDGERGAPLTTLVKELTQL